MAGAEEPEEAVSAEVILSQNSWEVGGPNDPTVAFKDLNECLHEVKEELSPWGWRAYHTEFNERQTAERRLRALASMPGSGSEPCDGVIKGTPLWQERLDHLLLVEHLKKKIMVAHSKFNDASELFLKSHGWLVQDYNLADLFVKFITTVPESAHDRVDYLQAQLEQSRRDVLNKTHEMEDFVETLRRQREEFVKRTLVHLALRNKKVTKDDILVSWKYTAQREKLLALRSRNETLQARVLSVEMEASESTEFLWESQRRWTEEKAGLIKERDEYKKKWTKMVKAHEQALADLKRTEGTAEGMKNTIMTLSQEKAELESMNEVLEEEKRVMAKQLAELRDELAKIRQEVRRITAQLKETEAVLVDLRLEVDRLDSDRLSLEARLDDAAVIEVTLREEVVRWKAEHAASENRSKTLRVDLADTQQTVRDLEALRDELLESIDDLKAEVQRIIGECKLEVARMKGKCKQEIEDFRQGELVRVKAEFQAKTDIIIRRNDMLEKEVKVGDALGPHLSVLAPLNNDSSKICPLCRKIVVYEGGLPGGPRGDPAYNQGEAAYPPRR